MASLRGFNCQISLVLAKMGSCAPVTEIVKARGAKVADGGLHRVCGCSVFCIQIIALLSLMRRWDPAFGTGEHEHVWETVGLAVLVVIEMETQSPVAGGPSA